MLHTKGFIYHLSEKLFLFNNNKPNLVLYSVRDKTAFFVDFTPSDYNINRSHKIYKIKIFLTKYKEIHGMKAVQVIAIIIALTGLVQKLFSVIVIVQSRSLNVNS